MTDWEKEIDNHIKKISDKYGKDALNIPIGEAVVGGFTAILMSELIDGFMPKKWYLRVLNWVFRHSPTWLRKRWFALALHRDKKRGSLMRLITAGVLMSYPSIISGSKTAALLLAYDAMQDLCSLDKWVEEMAKKTVKKGRLKSG